MPEQPLTAIRKVLNALDALPIPTVGTNHFIDRTDAEPLDETERPGVVWRVPHMGFNLLGGETHHTVTLQGDFQSANLAGETIDEINQRAIAEFVAALQVDRTLGGMLIDIEETDADGTEQSGADVGTAILTLRAQFLTPRGDFFTIVGQSGETF